MVHDSQHYLVKKIDQNTDTFDGYTVRRGNCVLKTGLKVNKTTFKVDYGDLSTMNVVKSLELAESNTSCKRWSCSSRFVTMTKCSLTHSIDESCLIDKDLSLTSFTPVSVHISVGVGDHLVIKPQDTAVFHSALVYKCIDECRFLIVPPLPQANGDEVDLSPSRFAGEAYRINYKQSLPGNEVLKRARSKTGVSKQRHCSPSEFVTWAKVGQSIAVPEIPEMNEEKGSIALNNNVIHQCYEKILTVSEIRVGDHIFLNQGFDSFVIYRQHMLVTWHSDNKYSTKFRVAFCLRTFIQETDIDLANRTVYRVKYNEELPSEVAVERARRIVGQHRYGPLARMWFVTWSKIGSNYNSVEISLLRNRSMPVSKSKISSFTQLNPGDYLVWCHRWWYYHHYLVLSVESPKQCTVCESRRRNIKKINLTWDNEFQIYYRINYEDTVCFRHDRSVEHAKALIGTRDLSIVTNLSRQGFVHFLKTGEAVTMNVDGLRDDHVTSLELERIVSTKDLMPGDHLSRSIGKKMLRVLADATHHMIVDNDNSSPSDVQSFKVLHYQVSGRDSLSKRKGMVASEYVSLAECSELHRTLYPDRFDPKEAVDKLTSYVVTPRKVRYYNNQCSRLLICKLYLLGGGEAKQAYA